jgi:hypothetical protein
MLSLGLKNTPFKSKVQSSVLWTPSLITTALWLDASDTDTITESGGAVSQWDDKGSSGLNDATQAVGANQPLTNVLTQNGLNVFKNPLGSNRFMEVPNCMPASGNISMFLVGYPKVNTNAASSILSLGDLGGGTTPYTFQVQANSTSNFDGSVVASASPSFSTFSFAPTPNNGPSIYEIIFNFDTNKVMLFVDGNSRGSSNTYTAKLSTNPAQTFKIWSNRSGVLSPQDAWFGEFIFCESCDLTIRQKLEGYLAWKWGTSSLLPSNHPFKNSPPRV